MKSDETLQKLAKNPFYHLTNAEEQRLEQLEQSESFGSSVTIDDKKKESQLTRGNATVKEIGKLEKHPSDPVIE